MSDLGVEFHTVANSMINARQTQMTTARVEEVADHDSVGTPTQGLAQRQSTLRMRRAPTERSALVETTTSLQRDTERSPIAQEQKQGHQPTDDSYRLRTYAARATLNTLGPTLVVLFYVYIVWEYLVRPQSNGVIPSRIIYGKAVFFAWLILSIFLLDWAKSGIAGFEAYGLMNPTLAPRNAMQLMWHNDRAWGSLSGWWKAATYIIDYHLHLVRHQARHGKQTENAIVWNGPGRLWWYLAASSLIFYITIPLSGLSMDPTEVLQREKGNVVIQGANETNFGILANVNVAQAASSSWRAGRATAPQSPTVFYAPALVDNVSDTYYEDRTQAIYKADDNLTSLTDNERKVTIFSCPRVDSRCHGRAWGLWTSISCEARNIYTGMEMMSFTNLTLWDAHGVSSESILTDGYSHLGDSNATYFSDAGYGIDFSYLLAMDRDPSDWFAYTNISTLPLRGSFEMGLWQGLQSGYNIQNDTEQVAQHPLVVSSGGHLGYGVHCNVSSDVGYADLDAATNTFSNFERQFDQYRTSYGAAIFEWAGATSIQTVVWSALSSITPGWFGPPACLPSFVAQQQNTICNAFYGANVATGGLPVLLDQSYAGFTEIVRQPMITPARLTLAIYKLFGEAAAAMMAKSPSNWTSPTLHGLAPTSDLEPGVIPWQLVLSLLFLWWLITVPPQCYVFFDKRWSSTLEGKDMFRFGAQNAGVGRAIKHGEFIESEVLRDIPGMVGDLAPEQKKIGLLGLSRYRASAEKRYAEG